MTAGGETYPGAMAFELFFDAINPGVDTLTAIWSTGANGTGTVFASETIVTTGLTFASLSLPTWFADSDPQYFTARWTGNGEAAQINVSISAIPVPAAGLLLLAGLGSLTALRRRQPA